VPGDVVYAYTGQIMDSQVEVGLLVGNGPLDGNRNGACSVIGVENQADIRNLSLRVPREAEGDGYARLRVLFQEAGESVRIVSELARSLSDGPVRCSLEPRAGAGLGTVEAPIGAALHWVRVDEQGCVIRYRIESPSFRNWLAFRLAVEGFAFQDFPIMLATFGLSNAECDR
jgi:formate hydrogenlyase subunit 5